MTSSTDQPSDDSIPPQPGKDFQRADLLAPYGDKSLGFSIAIPLGWMTEKVHAETSELRTNQLKPLGVFASPATNGDQAWVQVQAVRLVREIAAAHWILHSCAATGRVVTALDEPSPHKAGAEVEFKIQGYEMRGRILALIDRDRLFMVLAFAQKKLFARLGPALRHSLDTFALHRAHTSKDNLVEPRATSTGWEGAEFACPASWPQSASTDRAGISTVLLRNLDDDGVLNGLIIARRLPRDIGVRRSQFEQLHLQELGSMGITLGRPLLKGTPEFPPGSPFGGGTLEVLEGTLPGNPFRQEVWICSFTSKEASYILSLLSPCRTERFYVWAFNKRAYDIVSATLRERG